MLVVHAIVTVVLTIVTQLGGVAWIAALVAGRGPFGRLLAFIAFYAVLSLGAVAAAPAFGRVPLPCLSNGPLSVQSPVYCVLNRHYVSPEMRDVATDLAREMDARYPGTRTLALDGSFPFFDGFPLIPHISHDDGRKLDLAFYYADDSGGYVPGATRSLLGYFAFEEGPTNCPPATLTLRWDLAFLQPLWRNLSLDEDRISAAVAILTAAPEVERIFIEPHLVSQLGLAHPKIRFQGCRAARHDDHIHFQIRES